MGKFPPDASAKGSRVAAIENARLARAFYANLAPVFLELHRQGLSLRAIARELEKRGIQTRQEFRRWHATSVNRALVRSGITSRPNGGA